MKSVNVGGCRVDILPIVKGLVSDSEKVKDAASSEYDVFAVSLGKEDIEAVAFRNELKEDQLLEDIDIVYLHYVGKFGEADVPTPAFSALVDRCNELSIQVQPLDMDEESYSKVYCDIIGTLELLREGKLARKAMKKKFDMSSPETFAISWDRFVNDTKGFRELTRLREKYMANRIRILSKNTKSMLAVIETERVDGIISMLEANING
jgi:hypothetical protein